MQFRKKPVVIEAVQWTGNNIADVAQFMYPVEPIYVGKQYSNADRLVGWLQTSAIGSFAE